MCAICHCTVEKPLFDLGGEDQQAAAARDCHQHTCCRQRSAFAQCVRGMNCDMTARSGAQRLDVDAELRAGKFWNALHQPSGNNIPIKTVTWNATIILDDTLHRPELKWPAA